MRIFVYICLRLSVRVCALLYMDGFYVYPDVYVYQCMCASAIDEDLFSVGVLLYITLSSHNSI